MKELNSLFAYAYMGILLTQLSGSAYISTGVTKIGGQYFLGILGVLLPNAALVGFFITLTLNTTEKRHAAANIAIGSFTSMAAICHSFILTAALLHVFFHGSNKSLQPMETFGDSGTSYFFAIQAIFSTSLVMLWFTVSLVAVYCQDICHPSTITLDNTKLIKCE